MTEINLSMNNFYDEVKVITKEKTNLNMTQKAVVLFRVALELGAEEIGFEKTMHLVSKLMTCTLGIMAGDKDSSFDNVLEDMNTSDMSQH
tara:strand:+ start:1191 stop:1460 length:270 start_codon:yes stop_codon:yes gene_type:complete